MNNEERRNGPMKKFAAALAALLVLSCGTTVLAAPSVDSPSALEEVKVEAAVGVDAKDVTIKEGDAKLVEEVKEVAAEKSANSTVLAVVDITVPEGTGKVTLTLSVTGVTKADAGKIYLLHEKHDGKWEVIHPDKVEDGKITATFTSLSPVAIVKIADTATTLPKSGATVVLPVLALICAAGAAGCAKKVKFN